MEFTEGVINMTLNAVLGRIGVAVFSACLAMHAAATEPTSADTAEVANELTEVDATESDSFETDYWQLAAERYDALRSSTSPRQQVLAGQVYLRDEDETPALVRPKRADVVSRAVQLAPDDAFVQWIAANQGSYRNSQCGPTRRPEAEVANIVRLEPDNAAAWQFAVALASVIGDEAGVDDALSRMAAAPRADDHLVEQIEEWAKFHADHPNVASPWQQELPSMPAEAEARYMAMQEISYRSSSVASVVADVCKMDVPSDRIWQRLGWCADAATTLATRGSSLALRKQGLELLAAIGQTSGPVEAMQKSYDWLDAHTANPILNFEDFGSPEVALGDWNAAKTEIEAIENRLRRTGQPLEPPPMWTKVSDVPESPFADIQILLAQYVASLIESMRVDSDARLQALAATADTSYFGSDMPAAKELPATSAEVIAELAARNPGNLLVQWIAAQPRMDEPGNAASIAAIAHVQRLEPDNGASWALSLGADAPQTDELLATIASTAGYDEHAGEILGLWLEVIEQHPPSIEINDAVRAAEPGITDPGSTMGASVATMMTMSLTTQGIMGVAGACRQSDASKKESCTAIARLLLHHGKTLSAAGIGEAVLRQSDALSADDRARSRDIAWWREAGMTQFATDSDALDRLLSDHVSTGSEIEAMRLAAQRAGKETPPESFQWPPAPKRRAATHIPEG